MKQTLSHPLRLTILVGFVLSALGIPLQIVRGRGHPPIPPGMLITVAGGLVAALASMVRPPVRRSAATGS